MLYVCAQQLVQQWDAPAHTIQQEKRHSYTNCGVLEPGRAHRMSSRSSHGKLTRYLYDSYCWMPGSVAENCTSVPRVEDCWCTLNWPHCCAVLSIAAAITICRATNKRQRWCLSLNSLSVPVAATSLHLVRLGHSSVSVGPYPSPCNFNIAIHAKA